MKRRFKFKINGECPRSLYLAIFLAKFRCDIYIYNFSIKSQSKNDDLLFSFSNFSKNLLSNLDIWNEIEDLSYSFDSIKFKDNLVYEQFLLRNQVSEKYLNSLGWTAKYSDIRSLLINKLNNLNNIHFISNNHLKDESINFDFEFNFKKYDEFSLSTSKSLAEQSIIFNVYLRSNVEKRLYEINTTEGLICLTPINKNIYQIIWNNASTQIKDRALCSKSFFLDNLTILLPDELKIDQIIGDINFLNVCKLSSSFLIKNKSIYFNENKFKSNILYNFEFDIFLKNAIEVFNLLENNEPKNNKIPNKFVFYYFYRKFIELKIKFSFSFIIIKLFISNNVFILMLRKLFFIILKRINLLKILIIKNIFNSKNFLN